MSEQSWLTQYPFLLAARDANYDITKFEDAYVKAFEIELARVDSRMASIRDINKDNEKELVEDLAEECIELPDEDLNEVDRKAHDTYAEHCKSLLRKGLYDDYNDKREWMADKKKYVQKILSSVMTSDRDYRENTLDAPTFNKKFMILIDAEIQKRYEASSGKQDDTKEENNILYAVLSTVFTKGINTGLIKANRLSDLPMLPENKYFGPYKTYLAALTYIGGRHFNYQVSVNASTSQTKLYFNESEFKRQIHNAFNLFEIITLNVADKTKPVFLKISQDGHYHGFSQERKDVENFYGNEHDRKLLEYFKLNSSS